MQNRSLPDRYSEIPSSGIPHLDDEHAALADCISALSDALKDNAPRDDVRGHLWAIVNLARAHFEHEERVMADDKYPHLSEHRERHATLLHFAESVAREFEAGRIEADSALVQEFWDWELSHIDGMDRAFWEYRAASAKNE